MSANAQPTTAPLETFCLGPFQVPRLFTGLWQLSSNAWGSASAPKVRRQMAHFAELGYTAFDMADHYGSSEIIFGQFKKTYPAPERILGGTKWCVFRNINPTRAVVEAAVQERLDRMQTDRVDLLQFHWQDYSDKGYITALRHLQDLQHEGKIATLGLCNFDAIRTDEICTELVPGSIVSNQVQFSLVDTRPLDGMADVCERHGVKLLTYGTLCGGFLADQWLGEPEPDLYSGRLTPSQRKYLDMIVKAWGDWALFQSLLSVLRKIGDRHDGVSIANVATRWVLDHACVGAVIIGARLGVSEHTEDNRKVFMFRLSKRDEADIEAVLEHSNGRRLITSVGDCGAEYR
ncbi:Aldo/keto reductase [Laetiporus sulphureus 93-53]|uniref:Aldo/keto reductase n=1 Tax=Laetiporus sulphureus 93-53 TaxID=1314785 RepID=A0A165B8C0_9APHY|nr:Aldo/keto reductase [Laetiporus sulphureus 93-53]KZT00477.1 Aldo/keto reductase [Laetiporus sulphureus 93-53]